MLTGPHSNSFRKYLSLLRNLRVMPGLIKAKSWDDARFFQGQLQILDLLEKAGEEIRKLRSGLEKARRES